MHEAACVYPLLGHLHDTLIALPSHHHSDFDYLADHHAFSASERKTDSFDGLHDPWTQMCPPLLPLLPADCPAKRVTRCYRKKQIKRAKKVKSCAYSSLPFLFREDSFNVGRRLLFPANASSQGDPRERKKCSASDVLERRLACQRLQSS